MIPLRDKNPTSHVPVMTIILIAVNALVFFYELSLGDAGMNQLVLQYGLVPARITGNLNEQSALTFITSMFLHGGWLHILGNMLYLWIFGNNIEDRLGIIRFTLFYFVCGIIAGLAQVAIDPASPLPMIGASGAIAGVLGGYIVLWPRARIQTLIFLVYIVNVVELPAAWVLGFWFALQLLNGVFSLGADTATGGVAFFAHVGGFIAGALLIKIFDLGRGGGSVWWTPATETPRRSDRWWD
jgi:membrane associated rhomboid family serine protease